MVQKWSALKAQFEQTSPSNVRELERSLTHWKIDEEIPIDRNWITLKAIRRELADADPDSHISEHKRFSYLMDGLPDDFSITPDTLDAQPNLPSAEKLRALQQKDSEIRLSTSGEGSEFVAQSQSDDPGECYVCWDIGHLAKDFPYQEEAHRYTRRLRDKSENSGNSRAQKSKFNFRNGFKGNPSRQNSVPKSARFEKKPILSAKFRYFSSRKSKAFVAGTESESQSETSTDSEESFTDDYAHVTRENSCKGSQNLWIADTAASSSMSNNKNVYRSLNSIPQRCIKVGGGKLYAREAGTAVVNLGGVKFFAKDTLFVPKLGANLLSGKKICEQMNLRGAFDAEKMYFHKNNKSLISASWKNGVYIIDHIAAPIISKSTNGSKKLDSASNVLETSEISVPDSVMEIDLTSPVLSPQQLKKGDTNESETPNNVTNDDNGDPAYTRPERIELK
ncbi:hypothetical protein K3495_g9858 [Podosphaera aphanis]|nr:hypothetical protein K3495_g9858 [Podosphaera aphanis]